MANIGQPRAKNETPENSSGARIGPIRFHCFATFLTLILLFCAATGVCHAQGRDVICNKGEGEFEAEFLTGVSVHVGAARNGELATRLCDASIHWDKGKLPVADAASQLDVDAFGVDLGLGVPVVAFQVKTSAADCCMEYKIYSLRNPAVFLRSITGGEFFSAADTDLDGRVEIWTDDAAVVSGFENLLLSDLDFAPPVVLRFARGKLLDASAEFKPYFDRKIADVRAKLDPQDISDFKNCDGTLAPSSGLPVSRLFHLRGIKIKVLEIVWSYLYSGREKDAWSTLAEMWPAADADRIRASLLRLRARGIHAQVDGVSTAVRSGREVQTKIFDATTATSVVPGVTPKDLDSKLEITKPRAILMLRPPPANALELSLAETESLLELVIDSAGKVRSVEAVGGRVPDEGLLNSTTSWKFIPAFDAGHAVASKILLGVSLKR
jgi:hypothetical protein